MKAWRLVPLALLGTLLSSSAVFAEDEGLQLDDLKNEFAAASATGNTSSEALDQFTISESDLDQEETKLRAQEEEILKKLPAAAQVAADPKGNTEGNGFKSASKSDVITVRGNIEESNGFIATDNELYHRENTVDKAAQAAQKEVASLKASNSDLNKKLNQAQTKFSDSQKELKEAKDRLMMAEAEVQRLSQLLEKRGLAGLERASGANKVVTALPVSAPAASTSAKPAVVNARAQEDLPIATVIVDKANLRAGPSTDDSALMSVSKGTRLVIETRQGSWYRVFAPNGTRAWVTGDVLTFSQLPADNNSGSALRVRAYDASAEKDANRLLGRNLN